MSAKTLEIKAQQIVAGKSIRVLSGRVVKVDAVKFLETGKGHKVGIYLADGKYFAAPINAPLHVVV